jgi:hypothetical protein
LPWTRAPAGTVSGRRWWRRPRPLPGARLRLSAAGDPQGQRASIALFTRLGYKPFGEYGDYYEDHMDAWRYEKSLAPHLSPDLVRVPFYEQTWISPAARPR